MSESPENVRRAQRRVGQSIGKYRIEAVIGLGGMATVYLAVHRNGHRVALKILFAELAAGDEDVRARFVREGYASNAIQHPGVARVIDDDLTEDGAPVLVMELLDGETLQSRALRCGGKLPPREVLAFAYQILDVVDAAHAAGILHRDLKPDNVLVTREGVLKVLDFGVARVAIPGSGSDPTRTGRMLGTPAFMAPEQAFGKTREIDRRSDVWSVGATMFSLLSGRHVHDAENTAELMVLAATCKARSLADVAPELPAEVVAVVDRACAFERADRFADARAMQQAIAQVYGALYAADVSTALFAGAPSRRQLESAPTLNASTPSLPPSAPSVAGAAREEVQAPARTRTARAALALVALGGAAIASAIAMNVGFLAPRRAETSAHAAPRAGCASSSACGDGTVCRAGTCVPLASEDCTVLARPEDVKDDRTVWIGAMFAKSGPMAEQFDGAVRCVELARRDFFEVASGLPARPGGAVRPIGVVMCDDARDPIRAARHLAEDVGVPAIVGFSRSKEVIDLAAAVLNPRHVIAFASNTASMLSTIPPPPGEPRMVWRTTLSAEARTEVSAALIRDVIEPDMRAHALKKDEPLRVAVTTFQNATGVSITDAIAASLRFNGKNATENGDDFLQLTRTEDRPIEEEARRFARELLRFRPHVILDTATDGELIAELEPAWKDPIRPRYVGAVDEDLLKPPWGSTLGHRLFSVQPGLDDGASVKFDLRYAAVFDPKTSPTRSPTGGPYDAFYALMYAIVAAGDGPISGPAIARALSRLAGPGPRIDVGPGGIFAATSALARGETIDLEGTMTSLDFDPTTGDPTVSFTVLCPKRGKEGTTFVASGLTWDGHKKAFQGAIRCP